MELSSLVSHDCAIFLPVGFVVVLAVLVFTFGFKSSVEPPSFKHISLSSDDKKNSKKKKIKDKKPQSNGHAAVLIDAGESKKAETKVTKQAAKVETPKSKKTTEVVQEKKPDAQKSPAKKEKKSGEGKKNRGLNSIEKPADFDEGEWEVAPSRKKEKSKKKDEDIIAPATPEKTPKKKIQTPITPEKKQKPVEKVEAVAKEVAPAKAPEPEPVAPVSENVTPAKVELTEPVKAADPVEDRPAKKKGKKEKTSVSEDSVVVAAPTAEEKVSSAPVSASKPAAPENPQAFNELEDAWKDAPQKKSKKKVRKD